MDVVAIALIYCKWFVNDIANNNNDVFVKLCSWRYFLSEHLFLPKLRFFAGHRGRHGMFLDLSVVPTAKAARKKRISSRCQE